jgi:L-fuculose-phosphate aldolase
VNETEIPFRIAAAGRILSREGCDSGVGGHISARAAGEDAFWVSPYEYFDQTVAAGVLKVGFDLQFVGRAGKASPAVEFHAAIYKERPDVDAIIHTHSHYAAVLCSTGRTIGMYHHEATIFYDTQAVFVEDGISLVADGKAIAAALGENRLLLMKNHGIVIASQSIESATIEALMAEKAARYHLESEAAGGTELSLKETIAVGSGYRQYYLPGMWSANLRRLRRSDPDLFEGLESDPSGDRRQGHGDRAGH